MPRTGRPKALLELSAEEREQLVRWARRRTSSQALALRSRIVLAGAAGLSNKAVAAQEQVSTVTVGGVPGSSRAASTDWSTTPGRAGRRR